MKNLGSYKNHPSPFVGVFPLLTLASLLLLDVGVVASRAVAATAHAIAVAAVVDIAAASTPIVATSAPCCSLPPAVFFNIPGGLDYTCRQPAITYRQGFCFQNPDSTNPPVAVDRWSSPVDSRPWSVNRQCSDPRNWFWEDSRCRQPSYGYRHTPNI
ncbi:hypothetical protein Taro_045386 [Colocasia esculenta]|uniref:Uncharacterized protein n=1 Tax=Colocasia esculenta TaxID=4460 RepID=A0A843WWG3_COLES|nr:hypothetical protein [Colocasia esculenta]